MRTRLDDAIDQVAAQMTGVKEDEALAARIASSLPERAVWPPSLWVTRFALGSLAAVAIVVVLRTFAERSVGVGPAQAASNNGAQAEAGHHGSEAAPVEIEQRPVRVASAFRRPAVRQPTVVMDSPDHEFSLPAIDAVAALNVDAIAPTSLPEDAPLTIESLTIADLPLTAEFPMKEE